MHEERGCFLSGYTPSHSSDVQLDISKALLSVGDAYTSIAHAYYTLHQTVLRVEETIGKATSFYSDAVKLQANASRDREKGIGAAAAILSRMTHTFDIYPTQVWSCAELRIGVSMDLFQSLFSLLVSKWREVTFYGGGERTGAEEREREVERKGRERENERGKNKGQSGEKKEEGGMDRSGHDPYLQSILTAMSDVSEFSAKAEAAMQKSEQESMVREIVRNHQVHNLQHSRSVHFERYRQTCLMRAKVEERRRKKRREKEREGGEREETSSNGGRGGGERKDGCFYLLSHTRSEENESGESGSGMEYEELRQKECSICLQLLGCHPHEAIHGDEEEVDEEQNRRLRSSHLPNMAAALHSSRNRDARRHINMGVGLQKGRSGKGGGRQDGGGQGGEEKRLEEKEGGGKEESMRTSIIVRTLRCGHSFHADCLGLWEAFLRFDFDVDSPFCPYCRDTFPFLS
uniref:RING-type domain-containing protein n=1 Tax=Palpitomonas bilix TaxID=652834 RepID=A0A7S3FZQ9_9EUKA